MEGTVFNPVAQSVFQKQELGMDKLGDLIKSGKVAEAVIRFNDPQIHIPEKSAVSMRLIGSMRQQRLVEKSLEICKIPASVSTVISFVLAYYRDKKDFASVEEIIDTPLEGELMQMEIVNLVQTLALNQKFRIAKEKLEKYRKSLDLVTVFSLEGCIQNHTIFNSGVDLS